MPGLLKLTCGAIIWNKRYGGSDHDNEASIAVATGGGYFIAFGSTSLDGTNTGHFPGTANLLDATIAKIDENGNILWTDCFGGDSNDDIGAANTILSTIIGGAISATEDGGCIFAASAQSDNGELTGINFRDESSIWNVSMWICKLDQNGTIQWQECIGGTRNDFGYSVIPDYSQGRYIVIGETQSNDGDIDKSYILNGSNFKTNAFLARISEGNVITGSVFFDMNSNGLRDVNESLVTGALVTSVKPGHEVTGSTNEGLFTNVVDTGAYSTTITYPNYTGHPSIISTPFHSIHFNSDTFAIALQPIPGIFDLKVSAFAIMPARPGFPMDYKVLVYNLGTENFTNASLKFIKDPKIYLEGSSLAASSIEADTLVWNFTNLAVGDTLELLLSMRVQPPPLTSLGDTLVNLFHISPAENDVTPSDNSAVLKQTVLGSFDPNDKAEAHAGRISPELVSSGEYLQYTIRFQNTGTDTAFNIVVIDTLDANLDWKTFEMVDASHTYVLNIENKNELRWKFPDILLVDSTHNEPLSHGFIVYRIKANTSLAVSDEIHNDASIYFDYNLPIVTNDAVTIVFANSLVVLPVHLLEFNGQLRQNNVYLQWKINEIDDLSHFEVERSIDGSQYFKIATRLPGSGVDYDHLDNISAVRSGLVYYRIKIIEKNSRSFYSQVLKFSRAGGSSELVLYPNPVKKQVTLGFKSSVNDEIEIKVFDAAGKLLLSMKQSIEKGYNLISIDRSTELRSGVYFIRTKTKSGETFTKLFIKQD